MKRPPVIPGQIQLYVPCDLNFRDAVGALIGHICRNTNIDDKNELMSIQVVSAFNEAFNNVVKHSSHTKKELEILVEVNPRELVIEIINDAPECDLDINRIPPPDLKSLPESGLGIFIMKSFMDQVEYFPCEKTNKNRLRMVRKWFSGN